MSRTIYSSLPAYRIWEMGPQVSVSSGAMTAGPHTLRLLGIALVLFTVATACRATPVATAVGPVDSTEAVFGSAPVPAAASDETALDTAATEPAVTFTFDPRIDLRLVRDDIDCRADALAPYDNTRVATAHYVVDGKLGKRCFGQPNQLLVEAWEVLVSMAPADHLRQMGVFVGYINELDIPAHLSPVGIASSLGWQAAGAQISVDLDHAFNDANRLDYVLVHEMGHVLAGARSQVMQPLEGSRCTGFSYRFRCFHADSLFTEFAALFWLDYLPSMDTRTAPSPEKGRQRCERDGGFFNAYAASDPFEDFAESYSLFVQGFEANTPGQQARLDWFARQPVLSKARDRAALLAPGRSWRLPQMCGV